MSNSDSTITTAIAWCLAWGDGRNPQFSHEILQQTRQAVKLGQEVPEPTRSLVKQAGQLFEEIEFPDQLTQLRDKYPDLWNQPTRIGLVYGGATKIKGYVFESAKLQDIRGASALLDAINLVDLPAFFGKPQISQWLKENFPELQQALIPELIIYSTGGNILAFCPAAFVHDLANAIERRYTEQTLTANSCAVGDTFKLLELRFGLLHDSIEQTPWLDWYLKEQNNHLVEAYFGRPKSGEDAVDLFQNRKSFNELAGKLAGKFNQRRSGNDLPTEKRPSRRYPPMFETHPYLVRDDTERRCAIARVTKLPGEPWFSDTLARKRIVGQNAKREKEQIWYYKNSIFHWQFGNIRRYWRVDKVKSWVRKFDEFLRRSQERSPSEHYLRYYGDIKPKEVKEALNLTEIGNHSQGFVAYIYADGNNMGGYIQKIRTPQAYQDFSEDISLATEESVYIALATHLHPHRLENLTPEPGSPDRNGTIVHPFEIITIGGDDVLLIVPANKALDIAKTIGEEFERILLEIGGMNPEKKYIISSPEIISTSIIPHRYQGKTAEPSQCLLSTSMGVLITAKATPIYYAKQLTEQLLKSAKSRAKELKKQNYYGGTVDFLVMKSVTMISSKISSFREQGLNKSFTEKQSLKLYAAPYTLHELGGLIKTAEALKQSGFPRSQLYQIRTLLERGKNTAILNYRYFRVRLGAKEQELLKVQFEEAWCRAKTNNGNLAPWMFKADEKKSIYETIWRDLVDIYPFTEESVLENVEQQQTKVEIGQ